MGVWDAVCAAVAVRRAAGLRVRGDLARARALAAAARLRRPGAPGPAVAEALAALGQGDAAGALAAVAAPAGGTNPAMGLMQAIAHLDQGDRAAARRLLGDGAGPNRVRAAYAALAGGDPVQGPWPAALTGEIPGAPHLRARVLVAAERRLARREPADRWAEGYLDVCFDVLEPAPAAAGLDGPGRSLDDAFRLFDARRWADALATLDGLATLKAGERATYRGACLLRLGRLDEAAASLAEAAEARPRDYFPVLLQGGGRLLAGEPDAAGERFTRALQLFPVAGELWYHVGLAALRAGRVAEARGTFERLAGLDDLIFRARLRRAARVDA